MGVFFFQITQHAMPKMSLFPAAHLNLAQTPSGGTAGGLNILFIGLMFAAMYFLMIAPQRKKQKAQEKMLSELTSGDDVITTGGIYGTITNVKDDRFIVRVADNTKIEVGKAFITAVVKKSA
jgi:preprotein translocase subunit YajC